MNLEMSKLSTILSAAAVLGGTLLCGSAQAAVSFVGTSTGDFGRVDTITGEFSLIGNTGVEFFDIAALDDSTGFGVTEDGGFFSINLADASTSLLGRFDTFFVNSLGFDDSGNLFGAGGDGFFKIDFDTVTAELVAVIDGLDGSGDIAFDGSKFFLTSNKSSNTDALFSINADGTNQTKIGNIGFDGVYGLTFQDNSLLGFAENNQLLEIDTSSGAGVKVADLSGVNGDIFGAAPATVIPDTPDDPTAVPEPSMALALVGLGVAAARKRKLATSH